MSNCKVEYRSCRFVSRKIRKDDQENGAIRSDKEPRAKTRLRTTMCSSDFNLRKCSKHPSPLSAPLFLHE